MLSGSVHKELSRPTEEGKEGRGKVKSRAGHAGNVKGDQWPLSSASESADAPILPATILLIKCMTGSMVLKEPASFGDSYFLPYESERCLLPNQFLPVILIIKSVQFS